MPTINPVEQWVEQLSETEFQFREPTGDAYDPNGPPAWLGGAGISYLREKGEAVQVTLVYGRQETAADLGAAGEFEDLAKTAAFIGDSNAWLFEGRNRPYRERIDRAAGEDMPPVNVRYSLDRKDGRSLRKIRAKLVAYDYGLTSAMALAAMPGCGMFTQEEVDGLESEQVFSNAGYVLHSNIMDWICLERTGQLLSRSEADGTTGRHAILSLDIGYLGLSRHAEVLGLSVAEHRVGTEAWPEDQVKNVQLVNQVLAAGRFTVEQILEIDKNGLIGRLRD